MAPFARIVSSTVVAAALALAAIPQASAASHHRRHHAKPRDGVSYDRTARVGRSHHGKGGYQTLVSDGPGSGYGFHRLPGHYRVAGAIHRDRQSAAVRSAVVDDAIESYGPFYGGLAGTNGIGLGGYGNRGVFSYPDGYGSPFFAGYYGEGDGADLGPLGHAYAD